MSRSLFAVAFLQMFLMAWPVLADPPVATPQPEKAAEKPVTLMGMLQPWLYPESEFGGASTSDAGVTDISSIKSNAIQTTTDSVDEVMKVYCERLKVDLKGKHMDEKEGTRITTDRSVLIQDLSAERPCKMFVIAVNRAKESTTVVVSRVEGEERTTIGWSNFRQLWP
ncbi:MAG: hypothetical protein ACR2NZ_05505 [Rubripirellula sp.]